MSLAGAPSTCSQTKASKDVSGSDASSAAKPEWRLAISEMVAIRSAEISTLSAK
ncbi:hypothetical protein GALL_399860 [mine drainage metagenome]|uniref:Uncharacterized protein n=1 Tax=mine drainage metagenome TaxID=410659 RepID=A0A1J5Q4R1_9ZZZZ